MWYMIYFMIYESILCVVTEVYVIYMKYFMIYESSLSVVTELYMTYLICFMIYETIWSVVTEMYVIFNIFSWYISWFWAHFVCCYRWIPKQKVDISNRTAWHWEIWEWLIQNILCQWMEAGKPFFLLHTFFNWHSSLVWSHCLSIMHGWGVMMEALAISACHRSPSSATCTCENATFCLLFDVIIPRLLSHLEWSRYLALLLENERAGITPSHVAGV